MDIDDINSSTAKTTVDDVDTTAAPIPNISAPADFDIDAINEAVAESERSPLPVEDYSSDKKETISDTPSATIPESENHPSDGIDTGLVDDDPLLGDPSSKKAHEAPEAAFVEGDIVDVVESDEDEKPAKPNPYENIGRDPLADDSSASTLVSPSATDSPDEASPESGDKLEAVGLDNAITTGPIRKNYKNLIIGIICGVILVGIIVALILVLRKH